MPVSKYAQIDNGVVINIIELDPLLAVSGNWKWDDKDIVQVAQDSSTGIGWGYADGAFVAPSLSEVPVVVPEVISDRQFFQQLATLGLCTQAEALAAVQVGSLPAQMEALLSQLPSEQQFPARMLLTGATEFKRNHPVVATFAAASGWSDAQTDQFWIDASQL